jgi:hypothetical protein
MRVLDVLQEFMGDTLGQAVVYDLCPKPGILKYRT